MTDSQSWVDREVRCRCGQVGIITGVEQDDDQPTCVWVSHPVRLAHETHIHRARQIPALMAQLRRGVS